MRHTNYLLKPVTIDNAKPRDKAYALTDGGGLLLEVLPSGTKTWRFKYHLNGKREKVTIGAYPAYTIKQARDRHEELRALVERGESPAKSKQASVAARKVAESRDLTVRVFARRWIDETLFYRSAAYVAQIVRWLDAYIDPAIGDMQLADVQPGDVLAIIKARADTPVTAERIRVIVQQFYNHAIRNLLVTTNPAQPLRGAIARAPVEHHRHLNEKELGRVLAQAGRAGRARHDDRSDQAADADDDPQERTAALEVARVRPRRRAVGHLPAERMKMGKPHRVFLSRQAVEILRQVHELTGHGEYVFPSIFRGSVPMGDVTLNHFFKRIDFGVPDFSPHGTRGTAATLLREHGFGRDVVELLLAHSEKNATVAAYSHMELAADRKRALQYLADRVEALAAGTNVIPLRAA